MRQLRKDLKNHKSLFLLLLPSAVLLIFFNYIPMGGLITAFQNYRPTRGIIGSEWVGFEHFIKFFTSPDAWRLTKNTLLLNIYDVLIGFPIPIIFAIAITEFRGDRIRKFVQTISYLPYFISAVVIASLVTLFVSIDGGIINTLRGIFGAEPINFLIEKEYFRGIYVFANIWRNFGWTGIIYIAAILGIDTQLYEAAAIDGAGTMKRIFRITIPCLMPTIIVMFLLRIGSMMSTSFELVQLLQEPLTFEVSDTIQTYVYRLGIANAGAIPQYSLTAAIGLFQSAVNTVLLVSANFVSKKFSESSLF